MAKRYLIAPKESKCIGCNLCVILAAYLQNEKLSLKNSPIQIKGKPGRYKIQIDYGIDIKKLEDIVRICPQGCFDILEEHGE